MENKIKEQEHFDKLAATKGEIWWGSTTPAGRKRLARRACLVSRKLKQFNQPLVLELGCGTGAFSQFVLKELPLLHLISGDLSFQAVQTAAKRYAHYQNVSFELLDATSLAYKDKTFEAVIGNSILHHLPVKTALKECWRVLKPGGIIWFSEPNMLNPQIFLEKNVRFFGKLLQDSENETAFFRWPLVKVLNKIGFQGVSVEPFDFLHPLTPRPLMTVFDFWGQLLEKIPFFREIAGSLLIEACKPR